MLEGMTGDSAGRTDAAARGPRQDPPPLPDIPAAEAAAADPVLGVATTTDTITVQTVSRRNWSRVIGGFAVSLVLLTAVGFAVATIHERVHRTPAEIALEAVQGAPDAASATVRIVGGGIATAHWSEKDDALVLVAQRVPEVGDGELHAVWLLRDDDRIGAATFEADADGRATVVVDGWKPADTVLITVETADEVGARPLGDTIAEIPTQ